MFSWSAGFCMEAQVPAQRSPEELVTNTLMLELGMLLKRADRLHQERGTDARRRRSSVDYSWLAVAHQKPPYEPSPGELLELRGLCAKIRPSRCGPVILRLRKLVAEFEPDAHEVPRILRMILLDIVEEEEQSKDQEEQAAGCSEKRRSKSLSFVTLRSRFLGVALGGSCLCQPREARLWPGEDDDGGGPHFSAGVMTRRVRSMPEMSPVEQMTQS
ncbi:protein RD3-like [Brienomyrus brachyistius]|uniref:protein RD3-like n=1 Tax=Brienomyrus brachyistius TaxID=42636 RepID=UPI0020B2942C|nr:protein RD3-like [Brienomyrus brachyistius]